MDKKFCDVCKKELGKHNKKFILDIFDEQIDCSVVMVDLCKDCVILVKKLLKDKFGIKKFEEK